MPSLASFAGRDKNAPMLTVHGSITKQSQPRVKIVGELCPTGFCLAKKKKRTVRMRQRTFPVIYVFPSRNNHSTLYSKDLLPPHSQRNKCHHYRCGTLNDRKLRQGTSEIVPFSFPSVPSVPSFLRPSSTVRNATQLVCPHFP